MKKLYLSIVMVSVFLFASNAFSSGHDQKNVTTAQTEEGIPSYARWGQLAVKETKSRYPKAKVIDYLHIGKETMPNDKTVEKFKLWLKEENREFGVFIDIEYDTDTDELVNITFEETDK